MKRIRLLFLMLLCVAGTALTARAQKVTLNFRNAKLEQVFGRITEQTGYTFYYARPTVNPDKVVSIAVADVDVRAALKQLLADDKVEIEIRDGKITFPPPGRVPLCRTPLRASSGMPRASPLSGPR